jgi:hypothetical protein
MQSEFAPFHISPEVQTMLLEAEVENVARDLLNRQSLERRIENPNRVQLRQSLRQSVPELDDNDCNRVIVQVFKLAGDYYRNMNTSAPIISPAGEPPRTSQLSQAEKDQLHAQIQTYLQEHPTTTMNRAYRALNPAITYPTFTRHFHMVVGE